MFSSVKQENITTTTTQERTGDHFIFYDKFYETIIKRSKCNVGNAKILSGV